jgi:hypothetical protein
VSYTASWRPLAVVCVYTGNLNFGCHLECQSFQRFVRDCDLCVKSKIIFYHTNEHDIYIIISTFYISVVLTVV